MTEQAIVRVGETLPATARASTNPAAVYLASLRPTGRRTMAGALRIVAELLGYDVEAMPWHELRYEHVEAIRTKLAETKAPATVNKYLAAIRGVLRSAWRIGLLDAESYHRAADVKGVSGARLPAGRAAGPGELAALMRVCTEANTAAGARDAAIVALAYGAGLRRAELAALELEHVTRSDDNGHELVTIRVLGKGDKERLAYLDDGAALAVIDWLRVRGDAPGRLFWSGRKGGRINRGRGLTSQAVRDIVARRADQAAIEELSPHDLRRTFVSDLLDAGVDIATVAGMAGHTSVQTTARYDRRGEAAKKKAARSLHVPYVPMS